MLPIKSFAATSPLRKSYLHPTLCVHPTKSLVQTAPSHSRRGLVTTGSARPAKADPSASKDEDKTEGNRSAMDTTNQNNLKRKTQAQLDEELKLKMEEMAGDGGASGVEYEDGKPVAMKRAVKENMFRYI
ncbi:hypothetical protein B0T19DRAFT_456290 [Cercophora scortea]|uniref:Uncharacterized protein n=1 Tax=Cercophora scortea TaxID=314031 RepID=A0AAE0MGM9_9PEZI|nr:hypothetical protein B0T19DRAFT_456290 [Cercophora scortea]